MSITGVVALVLATSGVCSGLLPLAYARMPARRLHREEQRKSMGAELTQRVVVNSLLSTGLVFGVTGLLGGWLFTSEPQAVWRGALQALTILALYDVLYYLMHRFLFHGWSVLRVVHAVHHRVRYPTAVESLFFHPLEGFLGLTLLMLCTWLSTLVLGRAHVYAFGACFFVYSWVNIIIHGGVALPLPYLGLVARKHAIHHVDMRSGNYASLTPLPDLLFGTAE